MRFRTFYAGTGYCLLLSSIEGRNVLMSCRPGSRIFDHWIKDSLLDVRRVKQRLAVVMRTSVDDEYIVGIMHRLSLSEAQQRNEMRSEHRIPALWHDARRQRVPCHIPRSTNIVGDR
jgi:hypothetical protein